MSRDMMILLILLVPLAIWLNLYAYYKYGRSLMKKLSAGKGRGRTQKKHGIGSTDIGNASVSSIDIDGNKVRQEGSEKEHGEDQL